MTKHLAGGGMAHPFTQTALLDREIYFIGFLSRRQHLIKEGKNYENEM